MTQAMAIALLTFVTLAQNALAFEVHGHRGARAVRAENSMSAFQYALEAGVDVLELDLHVTRDGHLVITHDPFLNPAVCVDKNGDSIGSRIKIHGLTLAQLKLYSCGVKVDPHFPRQVVKPGEKIPSLLELLGWLKESTNPRAKTVKLNIEIKTYPGQSGLAPPIPEFTEELIATAEMMNVFDRLIIQSFDEEVIKEARRQRSNAKLSILLSSRPRGSLLDYAKNLKVDYLSPQFTWLTAKDVTELQTAGIKTITWTPNQPDAWKKLKEMNVDGIITDDPAALIEFRKTNP